VTVYGVHAGTEGATVEETLALWRKVEDLGFQWLSVWDHFYPLAGGPSGSFESVASHAALASVTSRVRVGVLVYSVGYRHPAVLANAVSTIDHLSGGRAEVAVGAGWAEGEYAAYGLPFPPVGERMDMLEEGVQCIAGLLHQERVSFEGRHFRLTDACLGVRPVQERVPVWVGGTGEKRLLPMAARYADGWDAPLSPTAEEFAHKVRVLERACEAIGREPASISRSAHVSVVRDEQEMREQFGDYTYDNAPGGVLFGSDGQVLDGIKAFEEAGADQVLFSGFVTTGAEQLERVSALLGLSSG
jgi:alkanesulfonate monooxygenase SsuD/methylene tetrahydromethanopterin reductase-like flavin-dependent oxidoreductase (luciferase family)